MLLGQISSQQTKFFRFGILTRQNSATIHHNGRATHSNSSLELQYDQSYSLKVSFSRTAILKVVVVNGAQRIDLIKFRIIKNMAGTTSTASRTHLLLLVTFQVFAVVSVVRAEDVIKKLNTVLLSEDHDFEIALFSMPMVLSWLSGVSQ
jgi:hypothetical protein